MYVICYNESLIQCISTFFLESMIDNGQRKIKLKHTYRDKKLAYRYQLYKEKIKESSTPNY